MLKKIVFVMVVVLMFVIGVSSALADSTGGSITYGIFSDLHPFTITTSWIDGGEINLIEVNEPDSCAVGTRVDQPDFGEEWVFEAVADAGYRFSGWSYCQELFSTDPFGGYIWGNEYQRVYVPSDDRINVYINVIFDFMKGYYIPKIENSSGSEVYNYAEVVRQKNLSAAFKAIEYTLTFHDVDGTTTDVSVFYNDSYTTDGVVDLYGLASHNSLGNDTVTDLFSGWSPDGITASSILTLDGTGDTTCYDVYAISTPLYSLTFDAKGEIDTVLFPVTQADGTIGTVTYTFKGLHSEQAAQLFNGLFEHGKGADILWFAITRLGDPYSKQFCGQKNFVDCSYFARWCYQQAGVTGYTARSAAEQARYCIDNGYTIPQEELMMGDLIFWSFKVNNRYKNVSHVGIYAGNNYIIDASSSRGEVVYRKIYGEDSIIACARPYEE